MTENLAVLVCITEKFTPKKCMTQCVTLCMTQNLGATLLKIGVYDTKMYDTKCKTVQIIYLIPELFAVILGSWESKGQ